jgi:hypothetical protein
MNSSCTCSWCQYYWLNSKNCCSRYENTVENCPKYGSEDEMKEKFGSLSKLVEITITGENGSEKAVLAGIISDRLIELGAKVVFKIKSSKHNQEQAMDAIDIIRKKKLDNSLNLTDKEITIEIPME